MQLLTGPLGNSGLRTSSLCLGTAPLGGVPHQYGYDVTAATGIDTVRTAIDLGITFIDTSNGYAQGRSEQRVGEALHLAQANGDLVIATKIDPDSQTGDFSGARAWRSLEESLSRLGLDHVDLLYLHDPERIGFDESVRAGGPLEALLEMKARGLVSSIGVAGGPIPLMLDLIATDAFDVVLTHNRFTLLDRSAEPLLQAAASKQLGIVNAAPYGGGLLARGPAAYSDYAYGQGNHGARARAAAMSSICERENVPLGAVALQFSMRDSRIHSTVVGVSSPDRVRQTLEWANLPVPQNMWEELALLTSPSAEWLG
jgi:D-threo-aldose 1-dehydrogenase